MAAIDALPPRQKMLDDAVRRCAIKLLTRKRIANRARKARRIRLTCRPDEMKHLGYTEDPACPFAAASWFAWPPGICALNPYPAIALVITLEYCQLGGEAIHELGSREMAAFFDDIVAAIERSLNA